MRREKYIIHIGQPKTGTTALQIALSSNRKRLLRQGFLYPRPAFGASHGGLTVPFAHKVQRTMARHLGQDLEKARMAALDQWRAVAAEAALTPDATVLLSSEHFLAAPDLDRLPGLIEQMFGPGGKIGFVVYLRTPSEHFISRVQQQIKATHRLPSPAHDRLARLELIEQIAPVRARRFARDSLTDGDIVADFCALNGIDSGELRRRATEANTSISAEGMILLQDYRRRHHADSPMSFRPTFTA